MKSARKASETIRGKQSADVSKAFHIKNSKISKFEA